MIPQEIKRLFPAGVRHRGADYFAAGRVRLRAPEPSRVRARVHGTEDYRVKIDMMGAVWEFRCECPYAADVGVCKHMWAVLLAADELGLLRSRHDAVEAVPARPPVPEWKRRLKALRKTERFDAVEPPRAVTWPADQRIIYFIDVESSHASGELQLLLRMESAATPQRTKAGFRFSEEAWLQAPDPADRELAHVLLGARQFSHRSQLQDQPRFTIRPVMFETTLRRICETGRYRLLERGKTPSRDQVLRWDGGAAWSLRLRLRSQENQGWEVVGYLVRGDEELSLRGPVLLLNGLVITAETVSRLADVGAWSLVQLLRSEAPLHADDENLFALVAELHLMPGVPPIDLPAGMTIDEVRAEPLPRLMVKTVRQTWQVRDQLHAELSFDYDGNVVPYRKAGRAIVQAEKRRLIQREPQLERQAHDRLLELGLRPEHDWRTSRKLLLIESRRLDRVVEELTAEGWHVEADGKRYRAATRMQASVSSGIDWFELQGNVEFGDVQVMLPRLLQSLRLRERTIVLDDGTVGLLPVEWLQRYARVAALGTSLSGGDVTRFTRAQTPLLDVLLATLPEARVDETFARVRTELQGFSGVHPISPTEEFVGELRPYQREGLGWLSFLRRFGLGGCLADDMGLGKTVQVLALLESRRAEGAGPALVVVPRSLVFNWQSEAARFTPMLRVRDYSGTQRRRDPLDPTSFDLLITTYGTLRRDAAELNNIEFDYVVLDEAQAIKNANTASAKAARLLRGRHRLALSGTPIENRIDELWSLFEFLNPGMLGASSAFTELKNLNGGDSDATGRALLARALRPFMLRRTKEQVAPELPPRIEQTVVVEMEPAQRKLYDELRDHYRQALLPRVDRIGIKKTQIEILEALLRLRQAACHPRLIDNRASAGSAKLDLLETQLAEVVAEGHKALVFSQFTTFLALVRERLDAAAVPYEYLDGRTRDRARRVEHFQQDPHCKLFLISLRAGGYGLNLTAADYVFVLDPWWNPAVEAQAVDRTHRIGQQRQVHALRLIAAQTVEQKVLELQQKKRKLADAILGADAGGLATIGRAELELLLS
ncbi:MAG: DEAD/DEAH box helicase [Gemmatimonadota bacterium]